jgi:decaprenylphospho-beta-D-ribofuranose 2-oxidase
LSRAATRKASLAGWGQYAPVCCDLARPERFADATSAVSSFGLSGLIARGSGLAYGDAAVSQIGVVLDMTRLDRMLAFDPGTGQLRAEAGVTLGQVLDAVVPKGYFLPVTPGTCRATVGGAIACDVHGKNHHHAGSFGRYVSEILLLVASGDCVKCSRTERGDLFAATIGGMGLTGIILEATIALMRVESNMIVARNLVTRDLDETLSVLASTEDAAYSIAWIDGTATRKSLGRGVVMLGNHASRALAQTIEPGFPKFVRPAGWKLPTGLLSGFVSPALVRVANAALFQRYRMTGNGESVVPAHAYFYPLDAVTNWNRLYGHRGFFEYQAIVPEPAAAATIRKMIESSHDAGQASFFTSLKRMGPQGEGLMSFPTKGIAFSCDLPASAGALTLLDNFDEILAKVGGRIYLAKDARASARHMEAFYPCLQEFRSLIANIDPDGIFVSDLSRRTGISKSRKS